MSSDSNLMQMLGTNMRYLTQRQTVLSQNIANIDTPGYKGRDMKKLDFSNMASIEQNKLSLASTNDRHIQSIHNPGAFKTEGNRFPMEVSPTANNVSLDEEMAKISDTGTEYQMSSSLFRKMHQLYRSALGNR